MAKKFQRRRLADVTGDSVALASHDENAITVAELKYDYSQLDTDSRAIAQSSTIEIKTREKRAAQDIVEIGKHLIAVKDALPHGEFMGWVDVEFGWKKSMSENFMNVARKFPNFGNLDNFGLSALYLLSGPNVDDSIVDEARQIAESGEKVTHAKAKAMVDRSKQKAVYVAPELETAPAPEPRKRGEPFSPAIMRRVVYDSTPIIEDAPTVDIETPIQGTLLVELPVDVINELVGIIDQNGLGFLMKKSSVAALRAALVEVLE